MKSSEIRDKFVAFFTEKHEHKLVASSSVIGDSSLLFTNSGMVQFKERFLGQKELDYKRAANSQKCIRAGGKHNDLETVGPSGFHHTFFEMLGNWSFGDYFKEDAIAWAWEFLTEILVLDQSRIYVTVFGGDEQDGVEADVESEAIWLRYLPKDRIIRCGKKDNFWEMASVGPCGPCTEIHYDRTPDKSGREFVNVDGRHDVVELWNLVFIQFNRQADGNLNLLEEKHVDTGMGLERAAMVMQNVDSNYQTDLFSPVIAKLEWMFDKSYTDAGDDHQDVAFRGIADHVRMATIAIADGVRPGNKKRDAVLRSVIRRAFRLGWQVFGCREPFLYKLVATVVEVLGMAYPEVAQNQKKVETAIKNEELAFVKTISRGLKQFENIAKSQVTQAARCISGSDAFELHSAWGFPIDLTRQMAKEQSLHVDEAEYQIEFDKHIINSMTMAADGFVIPQGIKLPATNDQLKYSETEIQTTVIAWIGDGEFFENGEIPTDQTIGIITAATCLYAESGGQVGDGGTIAGLNGAEFSVFDCKRAGDCVIQIGQIVNGSFSTGDAVVVAVDEKRKQIASAHTATHLIHEALHRHLGDGVEQKGSKVSPSRSRFDFACPKGQLTRFDLNQIEDIANQMVMKNLSVQTKVLPVKEAVSLPNTRSFFEDKYGDDVRVVEIGTLTKVESRELCGGTHVESTGAIRLIKIESCKGVSQGVRRIVVLTQRDAASLARQQIEKIQNAKEILEAEVAEVDDCLKRLKNQVKQAKQIGSKSRAAAMART